MESNPVAAGAVSYTQELIALLGARDPLEVQAGLAARLRQAVEDLDGAVLRTPEAPGKWSVIEVLRHLADTELVYGYRMRMVVAQPGSPLAAYDQELWAESLRYREADLGSTLEEIERLRAANLSWLHGLSGEEMDRVGIHEERGEESVRTIVALLAAHDLVHLRQIERIKAALSGA